MKPPSPRTTRARRISGALLTLALLAMNGAPRAERPMIVDDASTLPQGGAKVEFGWSKDGGVKGFDGALGYGPIETLELELNFGHLRDGSVSPRETIKGLGGALKWVPLAADSGLSAGLKYEFAHEEIEGAGANTQGLLILASWTFEAGPRADLNLGREWLRADGERESANVWGVGLDWPLTDAFHVTLETFGKQHSKPDRAVGLRYELIEGLKISGAYGYGNDRSFANLGVAYEF